MDINTTIFALATLLVFSSDKKVELIERILIRICQIIRRK